MINRYFIRRQDDRWETVLQESTGDGNWDDVKEYKTLHDTRDEAQMYALKKNDYVVCFDLDAAEDTTAYIEMLNVSGRTEEAKTMNELFGEGVA